MLECLRSHLANPELEDAAIRISGVTWRGDDVDLALSVTDYHGGATLSEWVVKCRRVRECTLSGRFGDLAVHEFGHAAIRQYRDPRRALFFNGKAPDLDAIIGRLWAAHRSVAGSWIDFERYFNAQLPLRNLLSSGFGKLADGPDFLVQQYAKVLTEASVEVSLGQLWPAKVWTEGMWVETAAELSMLAVDTSFVVAEVFDDERRGAPAG
jgi:hypothetical protein